MQKNGNKIAGADALIAALDLSPHPEGGWYRQTWAGPGVDRPCGTAILFLLKQDEVSHWHTVDATEIWFYHAGAPLILSRSDTQDGPARDDVLGPDVLNGQAAQLVVPPHHWQSARSTGDWTLVSCTVSPGFVFEGFHLARPGFDIPRGPA